MGIIIPIFMDDMDIWWWTGTNPPGTEDLTGPSGAPLSAGDPAPYINTNTGENIVVYRGTDKHIHTMYWTTGAVGHDNLSGFAGSPQAAGDPVAYCTGHNDILLLISEPSPRLTADLLYS